MKSPKGELQPFKLTRGSWTGHFHPRVGPEISSAWLENPAGLLDASADNLVRLPNGAGLGPKTQSMRCASRDRKWFIKMRRGNKGRRALERSFINGLDLEEAGLPVPVHLAVIEGNGQTWLFAELLEGEDLDIAMSNLAPDLRPGLAVALAQTIADLHATGYRQRDLKAPNILVDTDSKSPTPVLLDLEGISPNTSTTKRTKDLARLAASFLAMQTEGLDPELWPTLVKHYTTAMRATGHASLDPKVLLERTLKRAHKKVARNGAKGRVLR